MPPTVARLPIGGARRAQAATFHNRREARIQSGGGRDLARLDAVGAMCPSESAPALFPDRPTVFADLWFQGESAFGRSFFLMACIADALEIAVGIDLRLTPPCLLGIGLADDVVDLVPDGDAALALTRLA